MASIGAYYVGNKTAAKVHADNALKIAKEYNVDEETINRLYNNIQIINNELPNEKSKVTGYFTYKSTNILQHYNIEKYFKLLIENTTPSHIIEIGTYSGGLTILLRDILDKYELHSTPITTYDINRKMSETFQQYIRNDKNIDLRIENIFTDDYNKLENVEDIKFEKIFKEKGRKIILCDGGNKPAEMNILSKYLKEGDIIMAHDYAPNIEYFNNKMKNKIWNCMEIQDSDIQNTVEENNLKPYLQDEFIKVAWVCKIKQ